MSRNPRGTRSYEAAWSVVIDVVEEPGADAKKRHDYQEELMIRMHLFLADGRVGAALRDHLDTLTDGRSADRVVIMPLEVSHPDRDRR
jgi:hypothetical protein